MITCVDLFCGLGGLTHGLARSGVRVACGVDLDADCRYAYEQNNASKFILRDVGELNGPDVRSMWQGRGHTLLAGCAPCQPFSTYSRSARVDRADPKWSLVAQFARLIAESGPDLVTMENVPQLLDHEVFADFLDTLSGYHTWHGIVDCQRIGIPQARTRLVLLASRLGPIELTHPEQFAGSGRRTVRESISKLKPLSAGQQDPDDPLHVACNLSDLNLQRIRSSIPGGTWRDWPPELVAQCHTSRSGATFPSVYGRMEWDEPAPTMTTQCFGYGSGRFGHPEQDRAITLREAAILQTFPESYQMIAPGKRVRFSVLGRLIGNAVPVRLGELIGNTLVEHVATMNR